jgi:aryl-alcohol dehydrogenase-like predicted oxidoreductase
MKYRPLGNTGIEISEIGFGAWGIGKAMWIGADDQTSLRALHRAVDLGMNFIDTALAYGDGHSERLIAQILRQRTEAIYIATKIPPKNRVWPAHAGTPYTEVFPSDYIIQSTEESLRNLRIERIDVQQFHVWIDEWSTVDEIWSTVEKLKREGKIRSFGISINDNQPDSALKAAQSGFIDAFQVIYNIFEQRPEDKLFPLCQQRNIGVIARVPLDEGSLTGTITPATVFPEDDWRNWYFQGSRKQLVYNRTQALKKLLNGESKSLPELALRFVLSHPAVSTTIPGMRSVAHVESNAAVADGRLLSSKMLAELKYHRWDRNFYSDDLIED